MAKQVTTGEFCRLFWDYIDNNSIANRSDYTEKEQDEVIEQFLKEERIKNG